jgi:hypothetical protein
MLWAVLAVWISMDCGVLHTLSAIVLDKEKIEMALDNQQSMKTAMAIGLSMKVGSPPQIRAM